MTRHLQDGVLLSAVSLTCCVTLQEALCLLETHLPCLLIREVTLEFGDVYKDLWMLEFLLPQKRTETSY